jgi:hypothetical protein
LLDANKGVGCVSESLSIKGALKGAENLLFNEFFIGNLRKSNDAKK